MAETEQHRTDAAVSPPTSARGQIFDARDYYRITFDGRRVRCYIRLLDPAVLAGTPPTPDALVAEIVEDCRRRAIQHLDVAALRAVVQARQYGEDILIAQGRDPVPGRDGTITYHFRTDLDRVHLVEDEKTGRVDFRELGLIQNVRPGQVLATATKPTPGRPGTDVFGKPVRPVPGQAARIRVGENVELSGDGRTAASSINGYVHLDNLTVRVSPVYVVHGDVDFKTGNIDFNGTVRITGSVLEDFKVAARGDIIVDGDVEKAQLHADGSVYVQGSILGKDGVTVRAERDVAARFASNADLSAAGEVRVAEELLNCRVTAGTSIRLEGYHRRVMGGHLVAHEEVRAGTIGSEQGLAATTVELRLDPDLRTQAEALEAKQPQLEVQCGQREGALAKLLALKEKLGQLTSEQLLQVRTLMEEVQELREKQSDLKQQAALLRQRYADQLAGRVVVERACYPTTHVAIHGLETTVNEPLGPITFEREGEEIVRGTP